MSWPTAKPGPKTSREVRRTFLQPAALLRAFVDGIERQEWIGRQAQSVSDDCILQTRTSVFVDGGIVVIEGRTNFPDLDAVGFKKVRRTFSLAADLK